MYRVIADCFVRVIICILGKLLRILNNLASYVKAYYNSRYNFAITDGNEAGNFAIDSSGRITLNNQLNGMVQDAYTLTVTAHNVNYSCQCDRTTVEVSVLASGEQLQF